MPSIEGPGRQAQLGAVRTLWRLRVFAGRSVWGFAGSTLATIVGWLTGLLIAQVLGRIMDGPLAHRDPSAVWPFALVVLGLGLVQTVAFVFRRVLVANSGTRIESRMRNAFYAKLQDLPVAFHDQWPSGQLLSRALSDLSLIRRWLSFGLVMMVVNVIVTIIGVVTLIALHWILGLVFLLFAAPMWWKGMQFEHRYRDKSRLSQDQAGDLATAVEESVHGIRVLKAFGRGGEAHAKFHGQAEELSATELSKAQLHSNISRWIVILPTIGLTVNLVIGSCLVALHMLSVGGLATFFASAAAMAWPIESIGFLLAQALDARTATDRFFEIIDAPNPVTDPDSTAVATLPTPVRGELTFRDVRYRYPDASADAPPLLDGVSLTVRPGETLALVGLTGSGKTTLTALAARLYDVTSGAVELDGVDIRRLPRSTLRTHLAMAFEDATLFSASVRDNVLLGCPHTDPALRERSLTDALRVAQATFLDRFPAGLDTTIGEEGLSLSGGQRQRVALARAIAAEPRVLVLDDPLSALDVETEERVQHELRNHLRNTTVLVVAHRPSTVALADRVALLDGGRITAVGTHTELLATSIRYRYIISSLELDHETHHDAAHADHVPSAPGAHALDTAAIRLATEWDGNQPPSGTISVVTP